MRVFLVRFLRETSGASLIDYSLMAAGVSLAIIVIVTALGGEVETPFKTIAAALTGGMSRQ